MNVKTQIEKYLASQPEPKRTDLRLLHELTVRESPECKLWFSDGKDDKGKVVTNPSIGYGQYAITYADGTTKDFYRVGLSANKAGISVYIMGLRDRTYLAKSFGKTIGKASVTGYCIKFRSIKEINLDVLQAAIRYRFEVPD